MDETRQPGTAPETSPVTPPPPGPQAAPQMAPPGMPLQYGQPPMPPYYIPPTNQFWGKMMEEKERTLGLIFGVLGSMLVFFSSFVGWKSADEYYGYFDRTVRDSTTFYAPLLLLSLALLAGLVLAYLWRETSAPGIFSVIVAAGVLAVGFGFGVVQIAASEPGNTGIIGTGAYLGLAGGILALLGSLLLLTGRKPAE